MYPIALTLLVTLIAAITFLISPLHLPLNLTFNRTRTVPAADQILATTIQSSDLKIAQYNERPAQHPRFAPTGVSAPAAALVPGCSLSFSVTPMMKTIL